MMAITGVERMVTSIGRRNELTYGLIPVTIPVPIPRIPDIMKAISPLNTVVPAVARNLLSPKRVRVVMNVFSGEGRTKSDFKCNDRSFHTISIQITEARLINCLPVNEIFIRHFSSYNIRIQFIKNVQIIFNLFFDFFSSYELQI